MHGIGCRWLSLLGPVKRIEIFFPSETLPRWHILFSGKIKPLNTSGHTDLFGGPLDWTRNKITLDIINHLLKPSYSRIYTLYIIICVYWFLCFYAFSSLQTLLFVIVIYFHNSSIHIFPITHIYFIIMFMLIGETFWGHNQHQISSEFYFIWIFTVDLTFYSSLAFININQH